jgi:hypothetical protein
MQLTGLTALQLTLTAGELSCTMLFQSIFKAFIE